VRGHDPLLRAADDHPKPCQQKYDRLLPKVVVDDPNSLKTIPRYPLKNSRLATYYFSKLFQNPLDLGSKVPTLCEKLG
jgi:hypothetical protein